MPSERRTSKRSTLNCLNNSYREIREEDGFSDAVAALGLSVEDWDACMVGLSFVLAGAPEGFKRARKNSKLRVATIRPFRELPEINVLFAFNEHKIALFDVYLTDPED